jgi:hypothetical protein
MTCILRRKQLGLKEISHVQGQASGNARSQPRNLGGMSRSRQCTSHSGRDCMTAARLCLDALILPCLETRRDKKRPTSTVQTQTRNKVSLGKIA